MTRHKRAVKKNNGEDQLQALIFEKFIDWLPERDYFFHCPNGGKRHIAVAMMLKRMGVRKGIPDILCFMQRGGFSGLVIELKIKPNKTTADQKKYLSLYQSQGYSVHVCYDFDDAVNVIRTYLNLDKKKPAST